MKYTQTQLVTAAVAVIVIGLGSFFGGMKYQQIKNPVRGTGLGQAGGLNGQGFNRGAGQNQGQGFRPTTGEIISQDDTSLTIKMMDGSSKIILIGDKTAFTKSTTASKSDLTTGQNVMVTGTLNSDGSITATQISQLPNRLITSPLASPTP